MSSPIATAWVEIVPSLKGASSRLASELSGVGREVGKSVSSAMQSAVKDAAPRINLDALSAGISRANAQVERASAQLASARQREADAAGKVRVAEAQLAAARSKYGADSVQVVRAEENLAKVSRDLETAHKRVEAAEESLTASRKDATRATEQFESAQRDLTRAQSGGGLSGFRDALSGVAGAASSAAGSALGRVGDAMASVGRAAASAALTVGKTLLGALAAATIGLAGFFAVTALRGGLDRALAIEQAEAKLTGLGHSAESVASIMQNALDAVRGTAFGLGDAAGVAATIVASGIQPGEELTRVLSLVGDAATIAGTDMSSMGAIFAKVAASNKLQMDTINQLHDAGIPALQLVAQELGVTAEEATRMASAGEISFATFAAAMEEGLGGAALSAGETFTGAMANLRAALGRRGADFWTPLLENFTPVIGNITGLVDDLGARFGFVTDGWGTTVATVATAVDGVITRIREAITSGEDLGSTILDAISATPGGAIALGVIEALGNAFTDIRNAIVGSDVPEALHDVGVELGGAIADALLEIGPSLPETVKAFSELAVALVPLIPAVADLAIELLPLVSALVDLAAEDVLPPVVDGLGDAVPLLEDLVGVLVDAAAVVGPMLDFWEGIGDAFDGLDTSEARNLQSVMDDLVGSADALFTALGFDGYQEYVDGIVLTAMRMVDFFNKEVIPPFETLRDAAIDGFAEVSAAVDTFLTGFEINGVAIGDILDRLREGFLLIPESTNRAIDGVRDAFDRGRIIVAQTVSQIVAGALAVWGSLVALLPQPIRDGITRVMFEFDVLKARIAYWIAAARGSFTSIGSNIVDGIAEGIRSGASAVANAIVSVVSGGASSGRKAAEIASPSKLFKREIGAWIPAGIAAGIDEGRHLVDEAVARTVTGATAGGRLDANVTYGDFGGGASVSVTQNIDMREDDPLYVQRMAGRGFTEALVGSGVMVA